MKSGTIAVILAGIVVAGGITYSFIHGRSVTADGKPPVAAKRDGPAAVLQVDDLARNPEDFKGDIILQAVVAGVKKSKGVFGVIDRREFEEEGTLNCPDAIVVPVKFGGSLPDLKTLVEITGRVVRTEKGLIIDARQVKVVR